MGITNIIEISMIFSPKISPVIIGNKKDKPKKAIKAYLLNLVLD